MSEWRDPHHARYYAWFLNPEPVFAAQVNYPLYRVNSNDSVVYLIVPKSITTGAVTDIKKDMWIWIGSSAGASDYGRARIRTEDASYIYVAAPVNTHDGELYPLADAYITVFEDYRVWMKPPLATALGGYFMDEDIGSQTVGYDQLPVANGGPWYANHIDPSTGVITVTFPPDGWNFSFPVADDAVLGGYSSNLFGGSETVSATSGTAANAVDGNSATYWQPASAVDYTEHLDVDWKYPQRIRKVAITCNGSNQPMVEMILQYSDNNSDFITACWEEGISGFGTPSTKTYYVHDVGAHRWWRLYPEVSGGTAVRIYEWAMYAEDRTAGGSPWAWDVVDGTITSGTSTSETITATFPRGFRFVKLTVTDTNGEAHTTKIPVLAANKRSITEMSYSGASITQSHYIGGQTAANMFDHNNSTTWWGYAGDWGQITLAAAKGLEYYDIQVYTGSAAPKSWTVTCDSVLVSTVTDETDWAFTETRRFWLDTPTVGTVWRITITDTINTTDNHFNIAEWNFYESDVRYDPVKVAIRDHVAEPAGQTMEMEILEAVDIPDGALVMVWASEYYGLTPGSLSKWGSGETSYEGAVLETSHDTASKLFDNDSSTFIVCFTLPCWGRVTYPRPQKIGSYQLQCNSALAAPASWTIIADGVVVDTQTSITWSTDEIKTFTLSTPAVCKTLEINITVSTDASPPYTTYIREWSPIISTATSEREQMVFGGWIDEEPTSIEASEKSTITTTSVRCVDVGQRLKQLPNFTMMAVKDATPLAAVAYEIKHATIDTFIYVMLMWMTSALDLADFTWSNLGDDANIGILAGQGSNIFNMIDQKASAIWHLFTCNQYGQLQLVPDPLRAPDRYLAREITKEALTAADYTELSYTFNRTSRYHWLQGSGLSFNSYDASSGSFIASPQFCIAPGYTPGQGVQSSDIGERLYSYVAGNISGGAGTELNESIGKDYAQKQAADGEYALEIIHGGNGGIDPAEQHLVTLAIPSTLQGTRGRALTDADGVVQRVSYRYTHESLARSPAYEWERRQTAVLAHQTSPAGE